MMGRQDRDQRQLFYEFSLDEMVPADHLLRRINVFATAVLADLHEQLKTFYSDIGRPSIDPELMIRMLLVGYCYGIRHERRLCQEVALHLAYRWFCKLDLDDKVPHHSTFSVNRLGRFRESEILRHIFERVVATSIAAGTQKDRTPSKHAVSELYAPPVLCAGDNRALNLPREILKPIVNRLETVRRFDFRIARQTVTSIARVQPRPERPALRTPEAGAGSMTTTGKYCGGIVPHGACSNRGRSFRQ